MSTLPALPYDDGTSSGHSGSDTSRRRARARDRSGATETLQRRVLEFVYSQGISGATCAEVERAFGEGHGSISGALSNLDGKQHLLRLADERHAQQVYVAPEWLNGRQEAAHHKNLDRRLTQQEAAVLALIREHNGGYLMVMPDECQTLVDCIDRLRA